ncbi:MAG: hypothetical protein VYE73_08125 [Acidobacteriota bacterium]|nr:hypothetical protein [Acidobacteriota bacterium]
MGLGPLFVGWLSDALMGTVGVDSLRYALLATIFFNLRGAVHYLLAARTIREELRV